MILATPTALMVESITTWIHQTHSRPPFLEIQDTKESSQKKAPQSGEANVKIIQSSSNLAVTLYHEDPILAGIVHPLVPYVSC